MSLRRVGYPITRLALEDSDPIESSSPPWSDRKNPVPARPPRNRIGTSTAVKGPTLKKPTEFESCLDHDKRAEENMAKVRGLEVDDMMLAEEPFSVRAAVDLLEANLQKSISVIQPPDRELPALFNPPLRLDDIASTMEAYCKAVKAKTKVNDDLVVQKTSELSDMRHLKAENNRLRRERNDARESRWMEHEKADRKITTLDQQIKIMDDNHRKLEIERNELSGVKTSLEDHMEKVRFPHVAVSKRTLLIFYKKIKKDISQITKERDDAVEKIKSTEKRQQDADRATREATLGCRTLAKDLAQLQKEVNTERENCKVVQEQNKRLGKERDSLLAEKTSLQELIDRINQEKGTAVDENRRLAAKNQELATEVSRTVEELGRVNTSNRQLVQDAKSTAELILNMKEDLGRLNTSNQQMTEDAQSKAKLMQNIKEEHEELDQGCKRYQKLHQESDEKIQRLEQVAATMRADMELNVSNHAARCQNLEEQLTKKEELLDSANCKVITLSTNNTKVQSLLDDERKEASSCREILEFASIARNSLAMLCFKQHHELARSKMTETDLYEQLATRDMELQTVTHHYDSLSLANSDLSEELNRLNEKHTKDAAEVATLQDQLRAKETSTDNEIMSLQAKIRDSEILAERRIIALEAQVREERLSSISDLKSLIGLGSGYPKTTMERLSLPNEVTTPLRTTPIQGDLNAESIMSGRRLMAFSSSLGEDEEFISACSIQIIKVALSLDDEMATGKCADLLWDLWANLESSIITPRQIARIGQPLTYLLRRVLDRCSLGDRSYWLSTQLVGYLSLWQFEDLQLPMLPQYGVYDRLLSTCGPDAEFCHFPGRLDNRRVEGVMIWLPCQQEVLYALRFEAGGCFLWRGATELARFAHHGMFLWIRLDRGNGESCHWLIPQDYVGEWIEGRLKKVPLHPSEASLLATYREED
ncbi:MAG: hypothetical protein Q9219_003513 [cf. Caloplaca sp. 3 TL-2023]